MIEASTRATLAKKIEDKAWADNAERKLLNLGTNDQDIISLVQDATIGPNASAARLSFVQFLIQKRTQTANALTNIMRTLSDTARSIISNFRS